MGDTIRLFFVTHVEEVILQVPQKKRETKEGDKRDKQVMAELLATTTLAPLHWCNVNTEGYSWQEFPVISPFQS